MHTLIRWIVFAMYVRVRESDKKLTTFYGKIKKLEYRLILHILTNLLQGKGPGVETVKFELKMCTVNIMN